MVNQPLLLTLMQEELWVLIMPKWGRLLAEILAWLLR